MKSISHHGACIAPLALLLATSCVEAADIRTWTDSTGKFKVEAQLISADDGLVVLKSKDGRRLRIPLQKLSKADREYLQSQSGRVPANPFQEVTEAPAITRQSIATLKRKLHGKFDFDTKTGRISLTYDWSSKNQLRDFELGGTRPTLTRGGSLAVPPGGSLRHVVDFKELTVAAPIFIPIMQGPLINTSGGAVAKLGGASPNTMYLGNAKQTKRLIVPEQQRKGIQLVRLTVTASQLGFEYGDRNKPSQLVIGVSNFHAGSVELCGGDAGFQYGTMVISGELDEKWVGKFVHADK